MLAARYLILLVFFFTMAVANVEGQDRLGNLRQKWQNRDGAHACSRKADCSCQSCGRGRFFGPNPIGVRINPDTGGISWTGEHCQPSMIPTMPYDAVLPDSGMQPDVTPGTDPTVPPIVSPSDAVTPPSEQAADDRFDLTSQFAGRGQGQGVRDLMIGDFFGGAGQIAVVGPMIPSGTIPIAGGDRRRKVSDHFSPIPVNRTFFSYHGFSDAVTDINGNQVDVQRFTFGVERMFWRNNASFQIRLPFVHGLDNTQVLDFRSPGQTATELGNLTFATKLLLLRRQNFAFTCGTASIIPTADHAEIQTQRGAVTTLLIKNRAVDVIPFASCYYQPSQNSWVTFTTQLDFNLTGNLAVSEPDTPREESGRFNDQNLFSVNISAGRWFWNDPGCRNKLVRGLAGIFELHYTTTITEADVVILPAADLFNPFNRTDTLNSTIGLRLQLGERAFATIAGVFPFRRGEDRPFENEFNFNLSRLY